jgi:sulfate adenylyltransferase
LLEGEALKAELARAASLPKVKVSSREKGDIVMMGQGGFTPLDGFMSHADWQGVCDGMKMASGLFWPIPITLSTDKATAEGIKVAGDVALIDPDDGSILATMKVTEKYAIDKAHECATVFKTTDLEHPGVKMVMEQGEINLAGPVKVSVAGRLPRDLRRAVDVAQGNPRPVRILRLEQGRRLPDAQPDAPLARVPGQGGDRDLRRRAWCIRCSAT